MAAILFILSPRPYLHFSFGFCDKGVAIYFGILGINEWIIVFISTLMWFLNVVLPVVSWELLCLELQPPRMNGRINIICLRFFLSTILLFTALLLHGLFMVYKNKIIEVDGSTPLQQLSGQDSYHSAFP
jgi:hypothetical protein